MTRTQLNPNQFYTFSSDNVTYIFKFKELKNNVVFACNGIVDNSEGDYIHWHDNCVTERLNGFRNASNDEIILFEYLKSKHK